MTAPIRHTMRNSLLLGFLLLASGLFAEHLPGGNITYRCLGNNQYEVTLQLWRECSGTAMIGQNLAFESACGVQFSLNNIPLVSQQEVSPVCAGQQEQTTCNGGSLIGIELYTYRTTLFLSPCDGWTIYWNTCCRNTSVNLQLQQGLYVEAKLNNGNTACVNSPVFDDDMPPFVCVGQPVSYDLGVTVDGNYTLEYAFIAARRYTPAIEPVLYTAPYTPQEPFTDMTLNGTSGNISFTPTVQGYVVCVVEVRFFGPNGNLVGTVMRDFPFVVQACSNSVPDAASGTLGTVTGNASATGPYAFTACAGGNLCLEVTIADSDASQALTLTSNVGSALPGATFEVSGSNPAVATICWNTNGAAAGTNSFTITANDGACPTPGSQVYTYTVTVAGEAANAGADATVSLCTGSVDLSNLLTGDTGGSWSAGPIVSEPGSYTYIVASPCGNDTATFDVLPGTLPNAGPDAFSTLCNNGSPIDLGGLVSGDPGGTWQPNGPLVTSGGTYVYTVSTGCGSDAATIVLSLVTAPNAGINNSVAVCANAAPFLLLDSLLGNPMDGGIWTGPDGAPHPPVFDPGTDPSGTLCYTVLGTSPCANDIACLTVIELPTTDPACLGLGLPQNATTSINTWPNPSNGLLHAECLGTVCTRAEVLDMQGRQVWYATPMSHDFPLMLPSALQDGSYLLRITNANGSTLVRRFDLVR